MGNTKSAQKQNTAETHHEKPPPYEEYNPNVRIPKLTHQPIKLKELKDEQHKFAAEQKKAYEVNYAKTCDYIIYLINGSLLNRNKSVGHITINIPSKHTIKYIPNKYLSAKLTNDYILNYIKFVQEMYKDYKIETTNRIGCITFTIYIPE